MPQLYQLTQAAQTAAEVAAAELAAQVETSAKQLAEVESAHSQRVQQLHKARVTQLTLVL